MRLLQSTWAELLTLTTAFRSLEFVDQGRDGGGDIDSVKEENNPNGLKLRYATDYWLNEQLARECCSSIPLNGGSGTTTTTTSTTTNGTVTESTTPTVLDIFNLVSIID